MHKNVFSYYIGVCLSCLELLLIYKTTYKLLITILVSILVVYSVFFTIIRIKGNTHLNKTIYKDARLNHFLWIYDEEHDTFLLTTFTCAKIVLFISYFFVLLVPVKSLSLNKWSLLPICMLVLVIYWKTISANFISDEYKIASWETGLTLKDRFYLYKTFHSFQTMGILPILTFCFYGNPILRTIGPFIILAMIGVASTLFSKFAKFE